MSAANMLKGKDNATYDVIRVLALASVVVGLGLEVYGVVCAKSFDMQAYGIGLGALFASVGAALKLKETTEPGAGGVTATQTTTVTETNP